MSDIRKGAGWAMVLVLFAAASKYGLIDRVTAGTMIAVIPALAVISLQGRGRCKARAA